MNQAKTAVVTGATNGIGEAIARSLAAAGLTVIMVGRNTERLAAAQRRIRATVPDAELRAALADLSLLADVRKLADELGDEPLDVVVSNAAVITDIGEHTTEGVQRTLATNHLAPYLLFRMVSESITAAGRSARMVVVGASPTALRRAPVDLDDLGATNERALGFLPSFRPFVAYGRTKNMNAMFVYSLARELEGTGITVNGAHPGIIRNTGLGRDSARGALRVFGWSQWVNPFLPGPETGADTPFWLATAPELAGVTGQFFVKRQAVPTAAHTTDLARCRRLWADSARLVGLPLQVGDHSAS